MTAISGIRKQSSSIYQNLFFQQLGIVRKNLVRENYERELNESFETCQYKEIVNSHFRPVYCLNIDQIERRYLLSGGLDSKICIFDLEKMSPENKTIYQIKPICEIPRKLTHKYCVSSICWYTIDTGLFFTGGYDNYVQIWDTNTQKPIRRFFYNEKIYNLDFSKICKTHSLIAVGYGKSCVSLCDFVAGQYTHLLDTGHLERILAVKWSPFNEHHLISASADGTMIIWDIRRSGFLNFFTFQKRGKESEKFSYKIGKYASAESKQFRKSNKLPKAHSGGINGLAFAKKKNHVFSTGKDSKMKLWDVDKFKLIHENFDGIVNDQIKAIGISVSHDGELIVHPNENYIGIYDTSSGRQISSIRTNHFEDINSCVFHPGRQEIYSCSNDHQIFMYSPKKINQINKRKMDSILLIVPSTVESKKGKSHIHDIQELSDSKVYFKKFFDYLSESLDNEQFSTEFYERLYEMLKGEEGKFKLLVDRLLEYVHGKGKKPPCGLLKKFFARFFETLLEDYEKSEDEELNIDDDDIFAEPIAFKPEKLFKKYFEQFFGKLKDDILKNGLDSDMIMEFVQQIYEFYLKSVEDENGEGGLGMMDLLNLILNLADKLKNNERRIIKPECLPVEINEEEVKCKKKGSTTTCKIKKKNTIEGDTKGKEKYSYKEESKIIEDVNWEDLTPEQQEGKTKEKAKDKGPDSKGKTKHELKRKIEGYLQVTTDEGDSAVMKYKVKCKYKYEGLEYTDEFAEVISSKAAINGVYNEKIDEFNFYRNFLTYMGLNTKCFKPPKKDDSTEPELYIPDEHQLDTIMSTLSVHLSAEEKDILHEDDDDKDIKPLEEEEEEKEEEEKDVIDIGFKEIFGVDFTISVVILSILLGFVVIAIGSMLCCTCCFMYFYVREKCSEYSRKKKRDNIVNDGYKRLSGTENDQKT